MNHGVYIHVPFCREKCHYCGFYSIAAPCRGGDRSELVARYLAALHREISVRLDGLKGIFADTVYFGGGTPSLLTPGEIGDILRLIREYILLDEDAEISLEMNPHDVSRDYLRGLCDSGVNRVTMGVQTVNEEWHSLLGRSGQVCTKDILETFFSFPGFDHCIDIITGIPGQTAASVIDELDMLTAFSPVHISAYLLSIEKGTPLARRMRCDDELEDAQSDIYRAVMRSLGEKGYEHYEISNYCLPGKRSRHNMKYWRFEPYVGFGPGAHSFYGGERYYNEALLDEYIEGRISAPRKDVRGRKEAMVEYIMTGLRLMEGFSSVDFRRHFQDDIPVASLNDMRKLESRGMLVMVPEGEGLRVRLTPGGIMMADSVIFQVVREIL